MGVIICTTLAECLERIEKELNDLERQAEIIAGTLEGLDEKEAMFEEFVKAFGGTGGRAFYEGKINSFEVYIQPHPSLLKEELSKKAKEISDLIEKYRGLKELTSKIVEVLGGLDAEAVVSVSPEAAKIFINIKWG